MKIKLLLLSLVFIACTEAQVLPTCHFDSVAGEAYFSMTEIPGENLPYPLYIAYDIPEGKDLPLLVYVHGWDGGGGTIANNFDPKVIQLFKDNGIGYLSVSMRGRNTNPNTSTDIATMESLRDAGALENYDVYKSIQYLLNNILGDGHINKSKISFWVLSGGGNAGAGVANKFPGLISTNVLWYPISKMGSYATDPNPSLTSWYTNNSYYHGKIQGAVGGVGKGGSGYTAGVTDEFYISRDHITGIGNSPATKFHVFHDLNDAIVHSDLSDALTAKLASNGQNFEYHYSTNGKYNHGNADLLPGKYDTTSINYWLNDVKTVQRQSINNSGTLHVAGYVIPVDYDLNPIFQYWIKTYRNNNPAIPKAQSHRSQGKTGAASVTYNLLNNTFETYLIKGNNIGFEPYNYVDITHGSDNVIALLASGDTVTLKPTTFNESPIPGYNWRFYYDFSHPNNYLLDDAGKVSNAFDLTGNKNIAFHEVRGSRSVVNSGYLDNGVLKLAGATGTLNTLTNASSFTLTNEFTIVFSIDPDKTSVTSATDFIIGKGSGGASGIYFANFSGKISVNFGTESGNWVSNATPVNTDIGKQVWVIRRDSANLVTATVKNSSGTYSYTLGTSAGSFYPKVIGASSSFNKQFSGKIYKVAASDDIINDTDMDTILTEWYNQSQL